MKKIIPLDVLAQGTPYDYRVYPRKRADGTIMTMDPRLDYAFRTRLRRWNLKRRQAKEGTTTA